MNNAHGQPEHLLGLLKQFAAAWNCHDCEALLSVVTDDCEFRTAAGPSASGTVVVGKASLRDAFPLAWQTWPDASWVNARHFVCGDRGVSEWTFRGTNALGEKTEIDGVDLFEFRDGKISKKDTYRKVRS